MKRNFVVLVLLNFFKVTVKFGISIFTLQSHLLSNFQLAVLTVLSGNITSNEKYTVAKFAFDSLSKDQTKINFSMEFQRDLYKMAAQLRLMLPSASNDQVFDREWAKVTIDFNKFQEQRNVNFLIKVMMENFEKSADFQLRFPMKKVNKVLTKKRPNFTS
jgi:hypothetical protein